MKINEKNLCTFATTPPVDLEGWMNKRGETNKSWQRRWFVLKGNLLFYFEKRTDKEPLGMIILEGCTVELAEESEQYCFQIIFHGPNNRTYYLSTESQANMEQWMKALTCAGYDYMKLMVAELQRQLDEIEGQYRERTPESTPMLAPPKAPPRRHNPFNKPLTTEYASNADTSTIGADEGPGTSPPTPLTRTGRKASAPSTLTKQQQQSSSVLSTSSNVPSTKGRGSTVTTTDPMQSPEITLTRNEKIVSATKSSDAIVTMADERSLERGAVVSYSFETMHSVLGVPVLADLSKWNASRQEVVQNKAQEMDDERPMSESNSIVVLK
uniref:PH domain-containing protein n=1 Tax=Anopheles minimus TaxID=112268 RepID=A0A182VVF6_9DIPT